jgi:7-alpha-hydroxysteroid dehydrogenase
MQVAIVTGASSGIGLACATALANMGCAVLGTGRDADRLTELQKAVGDPDRVATVAVDLTDNDAPKHIVDTAVSRWGRVDFLINNAGAGDPSPVGETDDETLDYFLNLMLRAPFRLTRDVLPHMAAGSAIINITSTMGRLAGRGFAAYGTAKAALAHYTRLAALDLCPRIRVNAIAPGSILTSALDVVAANDELRKPMEKVTPMRRLGDPVDIAAAEVYLASPAGSYLTGKTLEVDGGITFPNLDLPIPDL